MRNCVCCGVPIRANRTLCVACAETYGVNRKLWPDWLRYLASNYQAEIDYERRHPVIHVGLSQE